MGLRFVPRREPSRAMLFATPVLAVALTLLTGTIVFTLLGYDGLGAAREIFVTPSSTPIAGRTSW